MIVPADFAPTLSATLNRVAARAARAIAAEVPGDVRVIRTDGGIGIVGRALSLRSLADARLRDFAAIVRTGARR